MAKESKIITRKKSSGEVKRYFGYNWVRFPIGTCVSTTLHADSLLDNLVGSEDQSYFDADETNNSDCLFSNHSNRVDGEDERYFADNEWVTGSSPVAANILWPCSSVGRETNVLSSPIPRLFNLSYLAGESSSYFTLAKNLLEFVPQGKIHRKGGDLTQ